MIDESDNQDNTVRLGAMRALWGNIPLSLRAVSVDVVSHKVIFRAVFDGTQTEVDTELLSNAAGELIADFPSPYILHEEIFTIPIPDEMQHLKHLIFLRYEEPNVMRPQ